MCTVQAVGARFQLCSLRVASGAKQAHAALHFEQPGVTRMTTANLATVFFLGARFLTQFVYGWALVCSRDPAVDDILHK